MAYTYDWDSSGDDLTITQIRSEIGDDVEDEGVRPNGGNLQDAEILHYYADEGSHVGRTAARLCEVLARQWSRVPKLTIESGVDVDPKEVAKSFRMMAKDLREIHGHGDDSSQVIIAQAGRATAAS